MKLVKITHFEATFMAYAVNSQISKSPIIKVSERWARKIERPGDKISG